MLQKRTNHVEMFLNEQMFTNINTEFVLRVLKYGFNIKIFCIYIKRVLIKSICE